MTLPKIFTQFLITMFIDAIISQKISGFFVLMSNRMQKKYDKAFEKILDIITQEGINETSF